MDLSIEAHTKRSIKREELYLNSLIIFWLSFAGLKTARQEYIHALSQKAGAGEEIERMSPARGGEPSLFEQFAPGAEVAVPAPGVPGYSDTAAAASERLIAAVR